MNHPFSLSTAELAIADLSFNETADNLNVAGAGAIIEPLSSRGNVTLWGQEFGGPSFPIDYPVHPPVVIHPQPTPRPHPRPWPRPRPDHYFA
jgi:hypothetical protein